MKLDKSVVQRRLDLMEAEGIVRRLFLSNHEAGIHIGLFLF